MRIHLPLLLFSIFSYKFQKIEGFDQRSDCVDSCSHFDTSLEFGDCLKRCSRKPRRDNLADVQLFAYPPTDVHIETKVVMDGGKILETTINWKADEMDSRREGFYMRYTAVNSSCQKHFPGYFTSSILPDERSLTIPSAFNGHALVIDHSCTYHLQIRAKPYPPGDDKYIIEKRHTVPDCIEKYCSCRPGDVAEIRDVTVDSISSGYRLNWKFKEVSGKDYVFYVDVYERIAMPLIKKKDSESHQADEYTFRIANSESFEIPSKTSLVSTNTFQFPMPFQFEPFQQYKISIFAVDDSFCHNDDAFLIFNTTNATSSSSSSEEVKTTIKTEIVGSAITSTTVLLESSIFVVFLVVVACMSPVCTFFILFLVNRRRKEKKKRHHFLHRRSLSCSRHSIIETNILYRSPNEVNGSSAGWLISGQDIVVGTVIGEGAFGQVFKGILRGPNGQVIPVAVKQLKANAIDEEKEEFVREIQMMQTVGQHDNIVTMYGYCMDDQLQCMIMEYVPYGDLKHYLQNMRKEKDPDSSIDAAEFLSFAGQIACGMGHLESVGIIHRDLAARNILVGTGKVLKISDFGMSRPGVYIKMSKGVIPLRWLSPEAIKDNTYSSKSDVWAFGVLLWEIATLGGFPYNNVADKDILSQLTDGMRLEQPTKCSDDMYILMKSCWNLNPDDRPTFNSIFTKLEKIKSSDSDAPPSDPPAK